MENHIQTTTDHWIRPLICLLIVMSTQVHGSHMVDITLLKSAVSKGAVCLDGSPPAYFLQKGSGEGADNWLVYLENTDIKRRGARIFDAIMEDLLAKGMKNAKNAILSGGSAGGLGTILHCDGFRALLPSASRVKCISDSGFFIHAKDLPGAKKREQLFSFITAYHGITKSLPASCTSKMSPGLCLFPENIVKDIQTPFFFLESAFDDHQLKKHFFSNDPTWRSCTRNLKVCTPTQLQTMKDFRAAMIKTLRKVANSKTTGIFVHSCYRHGHFYDKEFWKHSPVLGDKTIVKAIGDWYFERSSVQEIDIQNELPQNCTKHA
ncbi:pectin acetylesterase 8-like isoform X2 [Sesamum indicum]|uniref:Pectin acetylesterase n=1 Tax=Sesamum indicum TaxID=4182 RepID=A0A8M8UNV3_SESIN|nr:pectin acetylesterase 8-like isoform X2 [Sesamum indicum]